MSTAARLHLPMTTMTSEDFRDHVGHGKRQKLIFESTEAFARLRLPGSYRMYRDCSACASTNRWGETSFPLESYTATILAPCQLHDFTGSLDSTDSLNANV